jgi:C4-dicarboxylate-binding protein DctP
MVNVSTVFWHDAGVKSFDALNMPFLVDRYDLDRRILDGPIGKRMLRGVAPFGLVGLGYEESGLRRPLAVSRRLRRPADFRGLRWRTPTIGPPTEGPASGAVVPALVAASLRALGATPVSVPTNGIYNALASRFVTAIDANIPLAAGLRLAQVSRFATANLALWPFAGVLVMNAARLASLTPSQQTAIRQAAAGLADASIQLVESPIGDANNVAAMCASGLRFVTASAKDRAALLAAAQPVYARFSRNPETARLIGQIEKLKATFPARSTMEPVPAGCTG